MYLAELIDSLTDSQINHLCGVLSKSKIYTDILCTDYDPLTNNDHCMELINKFIESILLGDKSKFAPSFIGKPIDYYPFWLARVKGRGINQIGDTVNRAVCRAVVESGGEDWVKEKLEEMEKI